MRERCGKAGLRAEPPASGQERLGERDTAQAVWSEATKKVVSGKAGMRAEPPASGQARLKGRKAALAVWSEATKKAFAFLRGLSSDTER